jgi:hypothetical protein
LKTSPIVEPMYRDSDEKVEIRIDRQTFGIFLSEVASWARDETIVKLGGIHEHSQRKVVEHVSKLSHIDVSFSDYLVGIHRPPIFELGFEP